MKKTENLIWIIFFITGSIFLIIGLYACLGIFNNENKVETLGTITYIDSYRDSDGDINHIVYVSYNVNGKEYESRLNGYSSNFYEGKEINIYYDKNNPNNIGSETLDLLFLLFPGFGLVFVIVGGCGIVAKVKKNKIQKQLKENGDMVYAKYIETILNENYSINNRHPYNIICEWNNPQDNKKYIFKSDNIWFNPENIIEERNITTFSVYINRDNIKEYMVDIENITEEVVDVT